MSELQILNSLENRLGEAESKRQRVVTEYQEQHRRIMEVVKANKEAIIFVEKVLNGEYSGSMKNGVYEPITPQQRAQIAGLKHQLEQANVIYTTGVNKKVIKKEYWTKPENPKTGDLFYDGENYQAFYLGKWHVVTPVKG